MAIVGSIGRIAGFALGAAGWLLSPSAAIAAEPLMIINAPAPRIGPAVQLAAQFDLKLRLPEGRGLARMLLDAGVDRDDAAAAARLAAGHLGDRAGGCDATISISRNLASGQFRLMRVQLMTEASQTIIERRGSDLTIASTTDGQKAPRLA